MKRWSLHIFIFFLLNFSALAVVAQDAGMSDGELRRSVGAIDGAAVYTPGEDVAFIPHAAPVEPHDSLVLHMQDFPMQQATLKPSQEEEKPAEASDKQKDDSILTFNFLYYIIQKYKLQDIID